MRMVNYVFILHLSQTRDELARLRRDVVRSPKSPKTSLAAQAVLRRVENERDDSLNELRRTATERDNLRERLKVSGCCRPHPSADNGGEVQCPSLRTPADGIFPSSWHPGPLIDW